MPTFDEVRPRAWSIIMWKGVPHIILSYIHKRPRRARIAPWEYSISEHSIRQYMVIESYALEPTVVFLGRLSDCEVLLSW